MIAASRGVEVAGMIDSFGAHRKADYPTRKGSLPDMAPSEYGFSEPEDVCDHLSMRQD
jgi:hypothetical protein